MFFFFNKPSVTKLFGNEGCGLGFAWTNVDPQIPHSLVQFQSPVASSFYFVLVLQAARLLFQNGLISLRWIPRLSQSSQFRPPSHQPHPQASPPLKARQVALLFSTGCRSPALSVTQVCRATPCPPWDGGWQALWALFKAFPPKF